jgi:lipoprotein-anchoring transpeptidase ErfK/SrfK
MRRISHPLSRRGGRVALAAVLAALLTLTACGGGGGASSEEPPGPTVVANILDPVDASVDVPTSTGISFSTEEATETTVDLKDVNGNSVDGELDEVEGVWRPSGQLHYATTYVATVTAVGADGQSAIATSTFTTMPEPENTVRVFSFLGSDETIGVGMPLRIQFLDEGGAPRPIPEEYRAEVERRMVVRTEPVQEGTWHWVSGAEVHYRPREFWQPGTQIHYHLATGGLPIDDGWYLRNDLNVGLSVGRSIVMTVDDATKQMTVEVDGQVVRTIPVSLGEQRWPSSSGTMVIMEKFEETVFDTYDELGPEDGYRTDIEYAMRLTYGGEFIHAAPWSVADQGVRNVSHGCINMSTDNAQYLYELTHKWGDVVIVKGTQRQLQHGNGWTDWNLSWEEYQRGSALYQPMG